MIYLLRKSARAVLCVWLVVTLVFIILRASGDPVLSVVNPENFTREALDAYRARLGLDAPILQQYLRYLGEVASGDFGQSFLYGEDAWSIVMDRVPMTLRLMLPGLLLMLALGLPIGIAAALSANSGLDRGLMAGSVVFFSLPNFFLGVLLIFLFAVELRWLPSGGSQSWQHAVLPVFTIGASGAAIFARFTRSAMLETLSQPYVLAARARGLSFVTIVWRHAFPNTTLALVTVLGFALGGLLAGAVIVETIFAWPGLGRLTKHAVEVRDLPVVQVIVFLVTLTMVGANLVVDLLYGWLDPRIRTTQASR